VPCPEPACFGSIHPLQNGGLRERRPTISIRLEDCLVALVHYNTCGRGTFVVLICFIQLGIYPGVYLVTRLRDSCVHSTCAGPDCGTSLVKAGFGNVKGSDWDGGDAVCRRHGRERALLHSHKLGTATKVRAAYWLLGCGIWSTWGWSCLTSLSCLQC
jgi:hypothetical protein